MTRQCQSDRNGIPCSNDASVVGEEGDAWCSWHLRLCSSFRGGTWTGREKWILNQGNEPGKETMSNGYGMRDGAAGLTIGGQINPEQYEAKNMAARQNISPMQPTPKLPQILQAIKDLSETVDRMEKEFGMLHEKLACITSCPPPPEPTCGEIPANPQVELAAVINANTGKLRNLQRAMRSLGERIEL